MRRAKGVGDLARLRAGSRVEDQAHTYCLYRVGSQSMAVLCTPRKYADAVSRRQRAFDVCLTTDIAEVADRSTSIMTLPSWQPPLPEAAVPCGSEWCHSISAHRSAMSCFVANAGMAVGGDSPVILKARGAIPNTPRTSCPDARTESDPAPLRSAHPGSRTPPSCWRPSRTARAAAGRTSR